jgi:hypothetical protein
MSTLEMLIRHLRFILFMVLLAWVVAVGSVHWLKSGGWDRVTAAVAIVAEK